MKPLLVAFFFVFVASAGCSSTNGGGNGAMLWSDPIGHDVDLIYQQCVFVVEDRGYEIDHDHSSEGEGKIVTRWREDLAPFRYQGERRRVHLDLERAPAPEHGRGTGGRGTEDRPQPYRIGVRVERQRNEALEDPMNPALAEWGPVEHEPTYDERMLFWIQQSFAHWK